VNGKLLAKLYAPSGVTKADPFTSNNPKRIVEECQERNRISFNQAGFENIVVLE
jgi:hypothetical protein